MSSLALLLVSARTDRDIIIHTDLRALVRVREASDPKRRTGRLTVVDRRWRRHFPNRVIGRSNEKMASDKRKRLVATPGTVFRCRITRTL
ncbi:hypothetical protein FWK35_00014403 [Aphis craccivora]|uniref:Uncharacterized protein n=1 Tax=Aphis craccivora TaxID=307492 RepID=A0A6G0YKK2_APHCR|nr:hypothetical protein FWK35_00014403 [Aphis craccivora]